MYIFGIILVFFAVIGLAVFIKEIIIKIFSCKTGCCKHQSFLFVNESPDDVVMELRLALSELYWCKNEPHKNIIIFDDSIRTPILKECKNLCNDYGYKFVMKSDLIEMIGGELLAGKNQ